MLRPCNFGKPEDWQKLSEQHPWLKQMERCRKKPHGGGVLREFSRIPGFSERTIRSVLFEEKFDMNNGGKKCCDSWNSRDPGLIVPFSENVLDKPPMTEEELLLQTLMRKMGFWSVEDTTQSERDMLRKWLRELNQFYNLRNNNALKRKKFDMSKRYKLNYLDYSLFKYPGVDSDDDFDEDDEEAKKRRRRKLKDKIKELPDDARSDVQHMRFRLRSLSKKRKTTVEALLYYQPYVKHNTGVWKSFNPDLGSVALRSKLNELGCDHDFTDWEMKAMDYIIRGDAIPTHMYKMELIRSLRNDLAKLLIRKPKLMYDFFGFQIKRKPRRYSR
uniref:Enolase n=1 Tax=Zeugodacus cucurbitae TaxID=28588 RepID=A0A0A1X1W2_ZEUCU